MAPFVVRRALRHLDLDEEKVTDLEVPAVLEQVRKGSLERIYGANARVVAEEIAMHLRRGTVIDAETVKRLHRWDSALGRAQELI
jgi:hypothetical protein